MKNASLLLIVLLSGCRGVPPAFDGKIWAGDSATTSIQRAQDNEAISASDPKFDSYLCMSGQDFKKFYETYILGCEKWKAGLPMMSDQEALSAARLILRDK